MQCLVQRHCGSIGQQRWQKQLACASSQFRNQKQHSSRIYSVSGSRVQGWQPPQQDQQLPPPRAVAALEAPAVDLEIKQQQQQQQLEGAAPNLRRDNAHLRRNSKERLRMARDLGLHRTAAPGDSSSSSSSSSNVWVVVPDFTLEPTNFELAAADQVEAATDAAAASTSFAHHKYVPPKGWTAAAAPTAKAEGVAAAAASNGTTTYTPNTSSSTSSSSSSRDSWTRIFDSAIGTAVDSEAAATAMTAAANSAVAVAAAAHVASLESSWLWEQERQPLQLPQVPMVRIELAHSPDGREPGHFYMPDPLSSPCCVVESGQQQQQQEVLHQANDMRLVAAFWKQAGKAAMMDTYPEEDGVLLLGYEENGVLLLDDEDQQRQTTELRQQAAATTAPESTGLTEAAVAADALRPSSSSRSSNIDGEADAAAAAAAQQLPQQELQPEMATVEFCFRCVTKPGEQLWLVGDGDALGNWDPAKAVTMQWSEGHIWSVSLPFEQGTKVTYKALLQLAHQEPQHWRWQAGPNGLVEASRSSSDDNEKPIQVEHIFK